MPFPFVDSKWIWPDSHHWDIQNSYALFRKQFDLKRLPARAPLFITADQSYRLFVNGRFVCRGPARGFQAHWPYDEVDLRPYLHKGANLLAIRCHNPGRSNFQYVTQGWAGLLVAARWGKTKISSDATWRSIRQAGASRDTVAVSVQLFSQEHIDMRLEPGDWLAPGYDDSGWTAPQERPWNSGPWFTLEERGIPLLDEREIPPAALIGIGEGTSAKGFERVRDVVALRFGEERDHRPASVDFEPLEIAATGRGKFRSYLFDFGKTVVGNLTFKIERAGGGEILDTFHCETIDSATLTPDLVFPEHSRSAFGNRLVCRAGDATHHFYHHLGFRYLTVTVRDAAAAFRLGLMLNWTGYPLEQKGGFASSDAGLERIWQACAWTQQCCSLDAYVDTPWREQAQWWGDARVQAWNTFHLNGDPRLFRRGIAQIAGQTTPDGVTYGHAPTMAHECILPDFTLIWMLTLWDYYWQTGSVEPLLAHHEVVQKALRYFREHTDSRSGLITYDDRFWLFLDWTDLFKDGAPSVYNLWLLIALDKLALLYRKARQPGAAVPLEAWAGKLRLALGRLIDKKGLMRDGIDRAGKIVPETSIHSQTLALAAKLEGIDSKAVLERILLPYIRGESQPKAKPSAYWITYVFSVLIENGYQREVIEFIRKFWTPMAEHGTTWEDFNQGRGNGSSSHAWSAHPLYHLMQTLGGVIQTGAAWSEILFHPIFIGDHARTTAPSPRGPIISQWRRKGDEIHVELKLPAGVKARVELPGIRARLVTGQQKWKIPAPEI